MTATTFPSRGIARIAIDLDGVLTEHPAPLATAANAHFGLGNASECQKTVGGAS